MTEPDWKTRLEQAVDEGVDELSLSGHPLTERDLAELAANEHLSRFRTLSLSNCTIGTLGKPRRSASIIEKRWITSQQYKSKYKRHRRSVDVSGRRPFFTSVAGRDWVSYCKEDKDKGIRALISSPHLSNLTTLDLCNNAMGYKCAKALASSVHLSSLRTLVLNQNSIGERGLKALARSSKLSNLSTLNLADNSIGKDGARALASSTQLCALNAIDLRNNLIGDVGAAALASSAYLSRLSVLNIACNVIGPKGAEALAAGVHLCGLARLGLASNSIGNEGAKVLASSAQVSGLTVLDLAYNSIGAEGAEALAASTHLSGLTTLVMRTNSIGDKGAKALATSDRLTCLNTLNLQDNSIGDEGAKALASSAHLSSLTTLDLWNNWIGEVGANALAASVHLSGLTTLNLVGNPIRTVPFELIESLDAAAISRHLRSARAPLHAAKLLLVGQGEAGKTHTRQRLVRDDPFYHNNNEHRTHNIAMEPWPVPDVRVPVLAGRDQPDGASDVKTEVAEVDVRLYDVGGQPALHASHRFFMDDQRNAYLLVLDATQDLEATRAEHWLRMIAHHSPAAPVVVLVTKCDHDNAKPWVATIDKAWAAELADRTGANLVGAPVVGYGWGGRSKGENPEAAGCQQAIHDKLVDLLKAALCQVPGIATPYPPGFHDAMRLIDAHMREALTANPVCPEQKYLTEPACVELCGKAGLGPEDTLTYLPIFRALGLVHWVGDRRIKSARAAGIADHTDRPLVESRGYAAQHVFNPHWVKGPTYHMLWSRGVSDGVLDHDDIAARLAEMAGEDEDDPIWKRDGGFSQPDDQNHMLGLMRWCALCFPIHSDDKDSAFLFPDLLSYSPGDSDWAAEFGSGRVYSPEPMTFDRPGEYLPESLLLRFIGEQYESIVASKQPCYRDQAVVRDRNSDCVAKIHVNVHKGTLAMQVRSGTDGERKQFANWIQSKLHRLLGETGGDRNVAVEIEGKLNAEELVYRALNELHASGLVKISRFGVFDGSRLEAKWERDFSQRGHTFLKQIIMLKKEHQGKPTGEAIQRVVEMLKNTVRKELDRDDERLLESGREVFGGRQPLPDTIGRNLTKVMQRIAEGDRSEIN